ncbi:MAG: hypothetical protein M1814_002218 [Vezdaea aestivalis]|nr:MAG: hypothetical protein M1814_002218 [Vezdaea aestivalis]
MKSSTVEQCPEVYQENGIGPKGTTSRKFSVSKETVDVEQQRGALSAIRTATRVSISNRRGLFAMVALIPEVEQPYSYSNSTKWLITFVVAVAGSVAPFGSGIIFLLTTGLAALKGLTEDLHATPTVTNLSVALYMLSLSIFPLWWSSFSEAFGRRSVLLISFTLFVIWTILGAISSSIAMFIAMRMLSGGAAGSVQAVGAGTIADIWEVKERGKAMGIFYLGPLCGPLLAPIIGGAVAQKWGWRSTQWTLTIFGVIVLLLVLFSLPETLKKQEFIGVHFQNQNHPKSELGTVNPAPSLRGTTSGQSVKRQTKKWVSITHNILIDPLKIVLLLRFPAVLLTVYIVSITFGSLYVLSVSIQRTFSGAPYHFKVLTVGLLYIPNSLGYFLASIFGGKWTDHIMHREAKAAKRFDENGDLVLIPEDRMRENAWLGALLYPAALIWYGWTAERGVIWIVPVRCKSSIQNFKADTPQAIANFFFGIGSMLIFAMATTMLTEFMPKRASNGGK